MRATPRRALKVAVAFAAMEGIAYAAHRWVMHGPGIGWHESHHRPRPGLVERNDLYPLTFAGATIAAMAAGTASPRLRESTLCIGAGVSAYGTAYLLVHDGIIHRRLGARVGAARQQGYGRWVARAHASHHAHTGEPYGMLLPLTSSRRPGLDGTSTLSTPTIDADRAPAASAAAATPIA
jgi:beta-carotene 3-hydroxylase